LVSFVIFCSNSEVKAGRTYWALGLGDCLELGLWELGFTQRAIFPSTKRPEKLGTFVQLLACTKQIRAADPPSPRSREQLFVISSEAERSSA
jgi:hypothetical protein